MFFMKKSLFLSTAAFSFLASIKIYEKKIKLGIDNEEKM